MTAQPANNLHSLVICTNIFVRKDDKYLVIRRSKQKQDFPNYIHSIGGKIHLAEDPLAAAKRELKEESGVEAKNIKLEAIVTEVMHPKHPVYTTPWLIYYFSGDYSMGKVQSTEEGELVWMSKAELLKQEMIPSLKLIVKYVLNPNDGVVFARANYDLHMEIIDSAVTVCPK